MTKTYLSLKHRTLVTSLVVKENDKARILSISFDGPISGPNPRNGIFRTPSKLIQDALESDKRYGSYFVLIENGELIFDLKKEVKEEIPVIPVQDPETNTPKVIVLPEPQPEDPKIPVIPDPVINITPENPEAKQPDVPDAQPEVKEAAPVLDLDKPQFKMIGDEVKNTNDAKSWLLKNIEGVTPEMVVNKPALLKVAKEKGIRFKNVK